MRLVSPRRAVLALSIAAACAGVATAAAARGFPSTTYPPPVHSRGGALTACPNPTGLEAVSHATVAAAVASAGRYDHTSRPLDLRASDRAWWSQVRSMWRTGRPQLANQVVEGSEPLSGTDYAAIVRFSCGSSLVSKSLLVVVGPPHQRCDACRSKLFFVSRRGHALLYYIY
jgi:hypothetical protein